MRTSIFASAKLSVLRWSRQAPRPVRHARLQRLTGIERGIATPFRTLWTGTGPATVDDGNVHGQSLPASAQQADLSSNAASALVTPLNALPLVCPGCGAPSQTVDKAAPGYYGRKHTQKPDNAVRKMGEEDAVFADAIQRGAMPGSTLPSAPTTSDATPICDRCHRLVYENAGSSIIHPSIDSVHAMIQESPHRHNHIYHVIDAADFPMSVIPNLQNSLRLPRLRTQNRRSKHVQYISGRVAEVSFIITRADLLAPKKEQVDTLLPYMREILRQSLGRVNRTVRLGNVRMVSAKRGWWTPVLKEEIYKRGGAGWMVGKVNVGKSALMEVVYPKGRTKETRPLLAAGEHSADALARLSLAGTPQAPLEHSDRTGDEDDSTVEVFAQDENTSADFAFDENETSLLPPAQDETMYPTMPIISALPGTTASPIRLPFGRGRGELIDLPGVRRSVLSEHVLPEHHSQLIMQHRIVPEQHVIQPGQSLLLGGLIRITPKTEGVTFLMYPFLPTALHGHSTNTEKAIAIQTGRYAETGEPYQGQVSSSATLAAKSTIKSAGSFALEWDVTKKRAGPVTDPAAGRMKPQNLPFIVYGMDLLIEGVGWVEIVAQVRRPRQDFFGHGQDAGRPEIEVFSPAGAFVAARPPMNAWLLNKPPKGSGRKRPRQTISYKKRMDGGRAGSSHKPSAEV